MDTGVIIALITAAGAFVLGVFNAMMASRSRREERQIEAKAELARYRKPLLEAAFDLGARIDNIQNKGFDGYMRFGDRRDIAIESTLYRFARYFGTLEILRSQLTFLEFQNAEETKSVADQIVQIGGVLSSDRYEGLMLWREEQRAIGEEALRREEDGSLHCVGFATFVEEFEQRTGPWFRRFQTELEQDRLAASSKRLRAAQVRLQQLVHQLDEEGRYEDSSKNPAWLQR
ncbi:MAG: hypothetical protein ACTHN3_09630 [Solirubrobacterales bacterium]